MIGEADGRLLARYLAGECASAEAAEVERRLDTEPELRDALAFMREMRAAARETVPAWDTEASWQRLAARKSARGRRPALSPHVWARPEVPAWRRIATRVAAAVALVAGGATVWTLTQRADAPPANGAADTGAFREHVTARGERATIRLPDGSRVVLAAASRLRYAEPFGQDGRREMHLEGEALFEVEHDERRPFLVHTAHAVTEDLGTIFSVQEYPGDTAVRVVVAEGLVELRPAPGDSAQAGRGARLEAGQLASLGSAGDAVVRSDVNVDALLSWAEGRLVFEDAPVAEVLVQLARWYDLEFVVTDSTIAARTVSAVFAGEAVRPTLQLLASTLNLRYEQTGRRVVLHPRRAAS